MTKEIAPKERRRHQRPAATDPVFIELHHTFGPVKHSVYKVLEHDEFGLSFLVPVAEGYFAVGTPLKYSLIKGEMRHGEGAGAVRYHNPHFDEHGASFFKVGLQVNASFRDAAAGAFAIRPARRRLDGKTYERVIRFALDGREMSCELFDVSRYSASFVCDDQSAGLFRIGTVLQPSTVAVRNTLIYQGPVTITRIHQDARSRRRVVVEPRGGLIDVERIDHAETITTAVQAADEIIGRHAAFDGVDRGFKALVADLRCFLEEYRSYLDSPSIQGGTGGGDELLSELFPAFMAAMDQRIVAMDDAVRKLHGSSDAVSLCKSYFQKQLLPLLLTAPINHRSYFKPNGYPGDYEMIRMGHESRFEGPSPFAKMLHKYTTSMPVAVTTRKRTEYLAGQIREAVERSNAPKVHIFSIASGPALEIDALMRDGSNVTSRMSLTLLDQEVDALQFSQETLYGDRIKFESTMDIAFLHCNLIEYLRQPAPKKDQRQYGLIYAFGLFDYFDDVTARFVIRKLVPLLAPDGRLIVSNVSLDGNRYRTYMEFGFEWYVIYRDRKNLVDLADNARMRVDRVDEIENGMMKFLHIMRA